MEISYEAPTFDLFVPTVIDRVSCEKHNAEKGVPCFHIRKMKESGEGYYAGICNKRAKKGGMTHRINPTSLRKKEPVSV